MRNLFNKTRSSAGSRSPSASQPVDDAVVEDDGVVHPKLRPFYIAGSSPFVDFTPIFVHHPWRTVWKARQSAAGQLFRCVKRVERREYAGLRGPLGAQLAEPHEVQEIDFLSQCRHPLVVTFFGFYFAPVASSSVSSKSTGSPLAQSLNLVFELMDRSMLDEILRRKQYGAAQLDVLEVWNVLFQLALALDHLHSIKLLHRGITPSNILLADIRSGATQPDARLGRFIVKLSDFNTLKPITGVDNDDRGSLCFRSPEAIGSAPRFSVGSDVWSLCCTVFALVLLEEQGPLGPRVRADGTRVVGIDEALTMRPPLFAPTEAGHMDMLEYYELVDLPFPQLTPVLLNGCRMEGEQRPRSVKDWLARVPALARNQFANQAADFTRAFVAGGFVQDAQRKDRFVQQATRLLDF